MALSRSSRQYMGVRAILPPDLQYATRNPLSTDTAYVKGTLWLNTASPAAFMYSGSSGVWIPLGSTTEGGYPITPYVVGPTGQAGYQTIQSAINAANADGGGMVYVQPGTYTENLTFYDNIQLISIEYINAPQTVIIGVHTPPTTGEIAIRGIVLQSATHIFSSVAAGTCTISILECTFNLTNGYIFNLPNWTGSGFNINDCGELSTTNGVINNSGGAGIFTNNCQIGAGTANVFTANGDVRLDLTFLDCPANISGGDIFVNFALFSKTITCSGTATGEFLLVNSFPTATPCFTITSSNPIIIGNSVLTTSNNPCITGTGSVQLNQVTLGDNTNLAGTLTVTYGTDTLGPSRVTGNLTFTTAGNKIIIPTGANASVGTSAAMTAGEVTVSTTACSATAKVFYARATTGGTTGDVSITAQDGTGFTLTSTSNTETSTFNWWIINA